jgi:hypothetical protein
MTDPDPDGRSKRQALSRGPWFHALAEVYRDRDATSRDVAGPRYAINNGRRLIANALSPERRAAQATAPAAKVAATTVAKKPESTATTVHKAAAGASSAAAAK